MTSLKLSNPSNSSRECNTAPSFQMSFEKIWDLILDRTSEQGRFMFAGMVLSGGSHVQHQQAIAIALVCEVTPQTATNWLTGAAGCSKEMRVFVAVRSKFESEAALIAAYNDYFGLGLVAI